MKNIRTKLNKVNFTNWGVLLIITGLCCIFAFSVIPSARGYQLEIEALLTTIGILILAVGILLASIGIWKGDKLTRDW